MDGTHPLAKDRTYGYDKQAADVYSIALGYFIWDAAVSILVSSFNKRRRGWKEMDWKDNRDSEAILLTPHSLTLPSLSLLDLFSMMDLDSSLMVCYA